MSFHLNPVTGIPESDGFGSVHWNVGPYNMENRPVGITVSPNGKFVYVGDANVDVDPSPMGLHAFELGPTGNLTEVAGSPYYPLGFTFDPVGVQATEGWPNSMVVAPSHSQEEPTEE